MIHINLAKPVVTLIPRKLTKRICFLTDDTGSCYFRLKDGRPEPPFIWRFLERYEHDDEHPNSTRFLDRIYGKPK